MAKDTPLTVQERGKAMALAASCTGQECWLGAQQGLGHRQTLYIPVYSKTDSDLSCSIAGVMHCQMSPRICVFAGLTGMNYHLICKRLTRKIVNIPAVQVISLVPYMFAM